LKLRKKYFLLFFQHVDVWLISITLVPREQPATAVLQRKAGKKKSNQKEGLTNPDQIG
jgi:hypothetical protein